MCGIAGIFVRVGDIPDSDALQRMVESIRHRGPDESRTVSHGPVGFAISRLAIIDPAGSHQPLTNETSDVTVVFNGEIYNYTQLRTDLEARGHRFSTKGDGEVIVHGFEEWDVGVFEKLRGMFAIAVWDHRDQRLVLARDRMGIKPLYIYSTTRTVVFASEAKAIFASGITAPRLRPELFDCYLAFRYVPAPHTIFADIHKLLPGEYAIITRDSYETSRFHQLRLTPKTPIGETEARDKLFELLQQSVRYRLQSDVPLGLFLSGGLDSGFLVALARANTSQRLDTFSVGFDRPGIYNELGAAALVAKKFDTKHHEFTMNAAEFVARLPKAVYHMDEPMADPSAVPMQALSELASDYVKVVLSGEGGDELFAGYPRYFGEHMASRYPVAESISRGVANALRRRLSRSKRRGIEGMGIRDDDRRHLFWQAIISDGDRQALLSQTVTSDPKLSPLTMVRAVTGEVAGEDGMDRLFYLDLRNWLVEDLLLKKDKMGMSASIEARVPYLDQDVVEFAGKLPVELKVRGLKGKYVLRRMLENHLPAAILDRPKTGFAVPLASWFRNELHDILNLYLRDAGGFTREWLNAGTIDHMIDRHQRGEDLALELYSLLVLELWGRLFIHGNAADQLSERLVADYSSKITSRSRIPG